MKQGRVLTWFITFVLFAGVSVYMCLYIFDAFTNPFRTVSALLVDAEETYSAAGFFVREESVMPAQGGIFDVIPLEGERVGKGQLIATTYADKGALQAKKQLSDTERRMGELEFAVGYSSDAAQEALKLHGEITAAVMAIAENADSGEPHKTLAVMSGLRAMVYKKELATEKTEAVMGRLSELEAEREELKTRLRHASSGVYAKASGYFSHVVDGYEEILTPQMLPDVTVSELEALPKRRAEIPDGGYIGKMISGYKWYFLTSIPQADAEWITQDGRISVRFGRDYSGLAETQVERKGEPEGGRVVLVLSSTRGMDEISAVRRQEADIVRTSYSGIKVPKEALRILDDGSVGVYCVVAMQARFKKVEVIYEKDNYYLAAYTPGEDGALRPGDEIIVAARDLEDGKVISRG